MIYRDDVVARAARITAMCREVLALERRRDGHVAPDLRVLLRRERRRLACRQHPLLRLVPRSFSTVAVAAGPIWTLLTLALGAGFLVLLALS